MTPYVVVKVDDDNAVRCSIQDNTKRNFINFYVLNQKEFIGYDNNVNIENNYYQVDSLHEAQLLVQRLITKFPGTSWAVAQVLEFTYMEPGPVRKAVFTPEGILPVMN